MKELNDEKIKWAMEILSKALELKLEEITEDASIFTITEWDSLGHIKVIEEIEKAIGHEIDTEQLLDIEDVKSIAALNENS